VVAELEAGFGYRAAVDMVAVNAGLRFAIGPFGIQIALSYPFVGDERALASAALLLSWRFDEPEPPPAVPEAVPIEPVAEDTEPTAPPPPVGDEPSETPHEPASPVEAGEPAGGAADDGADETAEGGPTGDEPATEGPAPEPPAE
jgi:hypothetical protein